MKLTNKDVLLTDIRMSPHHWSRTITEEDVEDLADNIDALGQMAQIVVRPIGKAKRMYELIAGERRFRAVKKLGKKRIRCVVIDYSDKDAVMASLSEGLKTKKPNSVEWQQGAKKLKDLWDERLQHEDAMRRKEPPAPKSKKTKVATKAKTHSVLGRKKTPRRRAIEEGAKAVGVSAKTFERAVDREENLIVSALEALKQQLISIAQANRLAHMEAKEQHRQLPKMIKETREETTKRLETESKVAAEGTSAAARELLDDIMADCKEMLTKIKAFLHLVDGEEIDYPMLRRADLHLGHECGQQMVELLSFVEAD